MGLDHPATAFGLTVTPVEVVEDSRCPTGVQCIQAGTVRVRLQLTDADGTSEQVVALGETATTTRNIAIFKDVAPTSTAGQTIDPKSYRFTFRVEKR